LSTTAGNVVAPAPTRPAPWATVPRNADHDWNTAQTLHVAAAYSNPFRWASRRALFLDFRRHLQQQQNVVLHVAEIAYGDRPFEVTTADNPNDLRYRAATELFHKENLCNLAIRHFPAGWKYGDGHAHLSARIKAAYIEASATHPARRVRRPDLINQPLRRLREIQPVTQFFHSFGLSIKTPQIKPSSPEASFSPIRFRILSLECVYAAHSGFI